MLDTFNLGLLIATLVSVLAFIFILMLLRSLAGLNNDHVGYQVNLASMGAIVSAGSIATLGGGFWPSYDLDHLIPKGFLLFCLGFFQMFLLLLCIWIEKSSLDVDGNVNLDRLQFFYSITLAVLAFYILILMNARWSG